MLAGGKRKGHPHKIPVGYAVNKVVVLPTLFQWRNVTSAYVSSGIQNGVFGLGDVETSVNPFAEILRAGIFCEIQKDFGATTAAIISTDTHTLIFPSAFLSLFS